MDDNWLDGEIKRAGFSDYIFKKKYKDLENEFPDITFLYEEESDILSAYLSVVEQDMNPITLEKLGAKYFNNFVSHHAKLYDPPDEKGYKQRRIVSSFLDHHELDTGQVAVAPDDATGYLSIITVIHDFEKIPLARIHVFLREFNKKGQALAQEAEEVFWNSIEGKNRKF